MFDASSREIIIVALYRHPNANFDPGTFDKIFSFLNSFQFYILIGDLNAHHEQWGSFNNNRAGNLRVASLDIYQAVLLNPSPPLHMYFHPPH